MKTKNALILLLLASCLSCAAAAPALAAPSQAKRPIFRSGQDRSKDPWIKNTFFTYTASGAAVRISKEAQGKGVRK